MPLRSAVILTLSALTCGLLQTSCREREVQAYRVPKEAAIPPELAASMPAGAGTASAAASALRWQAPSTWTEKPATSLRRGSFTLSNDAGEEADFSVIAFPGDAGGMLQNLNRWRGQIGLPPLAEAELGDALQHLDVGHLHLDVVDFGGTVAGKPTRITGAVLPFGGESWFFKLMGPDALVAQAKPEFMAFLNSLEVAP